jgi:hypothetical protein
MACPLLQIHHHADREESLRAEEEAAKAWTERRAAKAAVEGRSSDGLDNKDVTIHR